MKPSISCHTRAHRQCCLSAANEDRIIAYWVRPHGDWLVFQGVYWVHFSTIILRKLQLTNSWHILVTVYKWKLYRTRERNRRRTCAHIYTYTLSLTHKLWRVFSSTWIPRKVPFRLVFLHRLRQRFFSCSQRLCTWKCEHQGLCLWCVNLLTLVWNIRKSLTSSVLQGSGQFTYRWMATGMKSATKGIIGHFSHGYGAIKHLTSSVLASCISVWWMAERDGNRRCIHHTGVSLQPDIQKDKHTLLHNDYVLSSHSSSYIRLSSTENSCIQMKLLASVRGFYASRGARDYLGILGELERKDLISPIR